MRTKYAQRLCTHVLHLFLVSNNFPDQIFFMRNLKLICVGVLIAYFHFSCSKGKDGAQGPPGTANVIYSSWFSSGGAWDTTTAPPYGAYALFNKAAQQITQAVMDSGVVLAYMKGDPTTGLMNEVFPLPYSVGVGYGFTDIWDFVLNAPGNIRFLYKSDNPWTPAELGSISFRYIIIPGGTPGGRMLNPRKMTYEEVCEAYGIPE